MKFSIPNILSFLRLALIPFIVIAFYLPIQNSALITTILFIIASLTDWFDGFLARKLKQITKFGAFIDPVADKLVVVSALVLIIDHYHTLWITIPALTMIGREIIISALREWMADIGKRSNVAVSWAGKLKTSLQMVSLTFLLWHPNLYVTIFGYVTFYFAMILTYWSMFQYLRAAKKDLMNPEHHDF